jgi:hypothetical protein
LVCEIDGCLPDDGLFERESHRGGPANWSRGVRK